MESNGVKEALIEKCRKLMALATSPNPHEALLASKKLGELMAKHAISAMELDSEDSPHADLIREGVNGYTVRKCLWEAILAANIAKVFDSKVVNTRCNDGWSNVFMGYKSDVEIAIYFFKYIRRQISQMAKISADKFKEDGYHMLTSYEKRGWNAVEFSNTYAHGMVSKVIKRLTEAYSVRRENIPSNCTALMVVKGENVMSFMNDHFPNRTNATHKMRGSDYAYHQGYNDGSRVRINKGVTGKNSNGGYLE